ncbi:unnamed protein product [Pieris macdunnoughi]|uniref:Uncharacterized protein n=1 Tax=Pieris macdunnoughi TaxID=345717 RepID=A0A821W4U3_9NEOP|nr:unnamed protein product [Pieris macdunnoughi]
MEQGQRLNSSDVWATGGMREVTQVSGVAGGVMGIDGMEAGLELDVFHRPDVLVIILYVVVLVASLGANTLLIFIVIKFQYMRRSVTR